MPARSAWIAGLVAVAFWPTGVQAQIPGLPSGAGALSPAGGASTAGGTGAAGASGLPAAATAVQPATIWSSLGITSANLQACQAKICASQVGTMLNEDETRERLLRQIFHPARQTILRVLNSYPHQLRQLSLDIYDDELVAAFELYVDSFEEALRKGSKAINNEEWPKSLDAAVQMMRYCIAQAADALEEMRRFCGNFDYDHLSMAQSLVQIAQDLSKQALRLTRY